MLKIYVLWFPANNNNNMISLSLSFLLDFKIAISAKKISAKQI